MKRFSKLLLLIIAAFISVATVKAASPLTIDNANYDENASVATVSGTSDYSEVMVSLFDGEELLTFKTVTTNNNDEYTATFNIQFSEDKTIIVKVGDINSTDYEIANMDVKKSVAPTRPTTLTDDQGNSLTILDSLKKFNVGDELDLGIQMIDVNSLSEDEKAMFDAIQNTLGAKNKLAGIVFLNVINDGHERSLEDIENGYKLFIKADKEMFDSFKKPNLARVIDLDELRFEAGKAMSYDSTNGGAVVTINNIGMFLLYDDISIDYKFLDGTENQTYILKGGDTLTLKVDADKAKFVGVYVDGKLVDKANYTVTAGSTVVTFTKDYMQSLAVGVHDVKVDFTDGQAITTIEVLATNPKTGDNLALFASLFIMSVSGIALVSIAYKRKAKN